MTSDVVVPEVGELGMDVTFVRWLKSAGDEVVTGEPLFEVDTEKSVMVVEAYASGILTDLGAAEGDIVTPRQVVARLVSEVEAAVRLSAAGGSTAGQPAAVAEARSGISPRARGLARELGIDAGSLRGSGPDGLVTEADVRAAAGSSPASPNQARTATEHAERARRAVAELTSTSWRTVPHFYLQVDADVEAALGHARPTPLICAAVARALVREPECNLRWDGDTPVRRDAVDLGLLVDSPHGLLVAVIGDADRIAMTDMADAVAATVDRARRGTLTSVDARPRSLTVSNLGMYPVDRFSAVIPTPDIMALAVGRVRTVAHWDGRGFVPRRVMGLTLSVDHRALDGAAAARFMAALQEVLEDPVAGGLS